MENLSYSSFIILLIFHTPHFTLPFSIQPCLLAIGYPTAIPPTAHPVSYATSFCSTLMNGETKNSLKSSALSGGSNLRICTKVLVCYFPSQLVLLQSFPRNTHFPHTRYFGLGQNSTTIKCVGHGWVCTYHFETLTRKVFIPLWDKHAAMPLTTLTVCFDGQINTHDCIFTKPL